MKSFINFFLIGIIVILSNIYVFGQEFIASNKISCTNVASISNSQKVNNGYVVTGYFNGVLNTSPNLTSNLYDGFLIKYNNDFEQDWIKHITGSKAEFIYDVVEGIDNSIYITGSFLEKIKFTNDDSLMVSAGTKTDAFVARYLSDGSFVWAKNIGANEAKQACNSLGIDDDGNLIISGYYSDSVTVNGSSYVNPSGIYIVKMDNTGNFIWTKNIETKSATTRINALKAYNDGYYFNGRFIDTVFFDVGNEISENLTKTDAFLYKTDLDGNGLWLRRSYSDGDTYVGAITRDEYDNTYYIGDFLGSQIETDATSSTKSDIVYNNGINDIFIFKYNKSGNLIWARGYGELGEEWGRGITYKDGFIYITGNFSNEIVFGEDTLNSAGTDDLDIFIGMLDVNGNMVRAQSIQGADGDDSGTSLAVDDEIYAYLGGFFKSSSIQVGDSTYSNPNPGSDVLLLAKYKPKFSPTITKAVNPTCNQSATGELIVTPYFGAAPFTYSWSHNAGLNDSTATGLSAGTYTVTVTDALDSTDVAQYTLTEPAAFTFNPAITQVTTCSYSTQGAINLNVSGGNGGNTYYWFESDGGSGVTLTAEDQSGLTTGTYHVTVTDSEGCNADTAIVISGPAPVTFGASTNTPYTGADLTTGAIDLELSGGTGTPSAYDASWTGISGYTASTQDITGLDPGNYTVTVTDNNSCEFDTTFSVLDNDVFFAYIADYKDACKGTNNGWAIADYYSPDGSTNISYLWDANAGNQTTAKASNLTAGSYYYVTVTDNDNSVSFTDSIYINQLTYDFEGNLSGTTAVDCKGDLDGLIDLSITSSGVTPYTYLWSNSRTTQDIVNLPAGTYSVTVTDANECSFSITNYTITEPEFALAATASIVSQPQCNGDYNGEIRVDANGGNGSPFTYQWNDPASQNTQIADGLDAGSYSVTVTDWKGCKASSGVTLTQPQALSVSGVIGDLSCYNDGSGTIALTVGGGTTPHSYFWETATGTGLVATDKNQSGLSAATYHVTITDANLCELEDSFVVAQPDQLQIDSEDQLNIAGCFGDNTGSITIVASGGTGALTYTLNPGAIAINSTGLFEDLYSGTYSVEVDDENGCGPLTSSSIEITEPLEIVIDSVKTTNATASDASDGVITVYASGGTGNLEYTLTPGDVVNATGIFDNLAPGDYIVNVNDENLCEVSTNSITVSFTDNIDLVDLNKYIQIYPNPTSSKISVDINLTDLNDVKIEILSTSGEILESRFVFQHDNIREEFDLSAYSKGIYFIRIHSDKANYTNKIVLH